MLRLIRSASDASLRQWLRTFEQCPRWVPFVMDWRVAIWNELQLRQLEAEMDEQVLAYVRGM